MKQVMNNPKSSVIDSVHRRGDATVVTFRDNETIYKFEGIPQNVVDEWTAAESKGRYFAKNIRGKYPFGKI